MKHPEHTAQWHTDSQYLILVSVPDEAALFARYQRAVDLGLTSLLVREPDLDDEATAFCTGPGEVASRLLSDLPLTLREAAMV